MVIVLKAWKILLLILAYIDNMKGNIFRVLKTWTVKQSLFFCEFKG